LDIDKYNTPPKFLIYIIYLFITIKKNGPFPLLLKISLFVFKRARFLVQLFELKIKLSILSKYIAPPYYALFKMISLLFIIKIIFESFLLSNELSCNITSFWIDNTDPF